MSNEGGENIACGTVPRADRGVEEGTGQGSVTQNDGKKYGGKTPRKKALKKKT